MVRDKDKNVIGIGTRSRVNVFQLNPTQKTCLVAKVDDSWLWHKRFCHINFDNIVKTTNMFGVRDLPKIVKLTNTIFKECVLAKHNRTFFSLQEVYYYGKIGDFTRRSQWSYKD